MYACMHVYLSTVCVGNWNAVFLCTCYIGGVLHPFTWTVGGKKEPLPAVLFSWVIVQVGMIAQKRNILIHHALARILAYHFQYSASLLKYTCTEFCIHVHTIYTCTCMYAHSDSHLSYTPHSHLLAPPTSSLLSLPLPPAPSLPTLPP